MLTRAFDLDGVLIPDCDELPGIGGVAEYYQIAGAMRPLFQPGTGSAIITGRLAEYADVTRAWIDRYLAPVPRLFHDRAPGQRPEEYKLSVLNANPDIQLYVESDLDQALFLANNVDTGCDVWHFSSWIQLSIQQHTE
jgi:hypothetical protein